MEADGKNYKRDSLKKLFDTPEYRSYKEKTKNTQKRKEFIYKFTSIGKSEDCVKYLIVANVIAFIVSYFFIPSSINSFALYNVFDSNFKIWQIITSMFLHGGVFHIFFNMIVLWSAGNYIVKTFGGKKFLQLYFFSGLISSVLCMTFSLVPSIGASGAICGLLAAMSILSPDLKVYLFFVIPLNLKKFIFGFAAFSLVFGILSMINPMFSFGIAHFGHLGGLVGGYALTYYWKRKLNF